MWGGFPPRNHFLLGILGVALLYAVLASDMSTARRSAWYGFTFGLGLWLPLIPWVGVYVGPVPWIALSVVLSIYLALFGALATVMMRLPGAPVWFALTWTTVEWARSSFPFGGFPWAATAFGQINSPLVSIAALGGAPLLTFAVALTGAGAAGLVLAAVRARAAWPTAVRPAAAAAVITVIAPVTAAMMWPSVHAATRARDAPGSTLTVAAVQGNVPRLGLDFNAQRRAVLDNHIRETLVLAASIKAGRQPRPDVVLWPENASDIDPLDNPDAAEEITAASVAVGAPILVGTLIDNEDNRPTNTVLVWNGNDGAIGRYDKHIIQPFGEYLPWRSFFRLFSSYADRAGNFRPGSGPSVVQVRTPRAGSPSVTIGVSTCWEVAFDRSPRSAVRAGAQLLYVPTNNATFGRTEMTYQQLAMSQIRAVEHGRSVVVAATTGVSAIVEPDGRLRSRTSFFTPATLVARIPLHTDQTVATRIGPLPQHLAVGLTLIGFLVSVGRRIRLNRHLAASGSDRSVGDLSPTDPDPTDANSPDSRVTTPGTHAEPEETDGTADT
ncbi:apolipoprotein N-acyltransferase [Williamsia sp. CHRR-6]|uniref:apolipoprotein N-acyltransferase n=1 Tax=Williamsia sp. CHRR-6 TaxID=2835871 RepID=UPI001BDABE52|nr:apolipoprotein N-acyltransferase [Williamsia sp. CHRR-6]MBT0568136.1 apolipoprotein N-acyltransferase [Williamsia sp. CHRR-6]